MEPLNEQLFLKILAKYNAGRATKEEIAYLEAYYNLYEVNEPDAIKQQEAELKATVKAKIDAHLDGRSKVLNIALRRYAAAAVILLSLTAGLYFTLYKHDSPERQFLVQDRAPGGQKATLTLANGEVIILDGTATGKIAEEAGTNILNSADGTIIYSGMSGSVRAAAAQLQNTIATSKGGQYQLVLADGTKVWLNAASSLTYPTTFDLHERKVILAGEAYFEVAKNPDAPFKVVTTNQTVEVLGTHFNVNAYVDEAATTTTLLEGSIRLLTAASKKVLRPGEQAQTNANNGNISTTSAVDVSNAIAWKNGVFSFENEDLEMIMREISRWYDIKIIYDGPLPKEKFVGEIPRNSKLSEVCRILELNNLQFKIEGNQMTVSARKQ
jgi:ferric-dicitrate binding protein FerR (iron transport regulator)